MIAFNEGRMACVLIEPQNHAYVCRSNASMRFAVGGLTPGMKVLRLCSPYSTSVVLRMRATRTRMLSWDLRHPDNNDAEIVRVVLFVALLTRRGAVPGELGRMEPGTKSK